MRQGDGPGHTLRLLLNIFLPILCLLAAAFLVPRLIRFFLPFVIGFILALVAIPLVRFLEKRLRLVRRHSSMLIVGLVLAALLGLIYLIVSRSILFMRTFIGDLPALSEAVEGELGAALRRVGSRFSGIFPAAVGEGLNEIKNNIGTYISTLVERAASPTVEAATVVARGIPAVMVNVVVTILSAYFFIAQMDQVLVAAQRFLPDALVRYIRHLKGEGRRLIGGYFLAQFKIMAVVWIVLSVGLFLLRVHYGLLWAFLIAFLDFLPVFGTGTALIPWGVVRFLTGDYAFAAGLLILYVLTQLIRQLVQPKLVGDSMGLNPLTTLFLLYLGFKVRGIAGMILAVPAGLIVADLWHFGAFRTVTESAGELAGDLRRYLKGEEK